MGSRSNCNHNQQDSCSRKQPGPTHFGKACLCRRIQGSLHLVVAVRLLNLRQATFILGQQARILSRELGLLWAWHLSLLVYLHLTLATPATPFRALEGKITRVDLESCGQRLLQLLRSHPSPRRSPR